MEVLDISKMDDLTIATQMDVHTTRSGCTNIFKYAPIYDATICSNTNFNDVHISLNILPHMRQPLAKVPNSMPWTWNGEPQYANFRALLQRSVLLNLSQCSTSTHYNQVPNLNIIQNSPTPIYPEILEDR
ncbi:hypothetical protein LOK49_LG05G00971 [Camellia lanceoleosa]|uniref:Uncharacterized protein n=1 Tax=Camellia lanceoleosa TaxID=1840588 RepID=A0ACC0HT96_9ERIC|nr:hypothetical protein LOK49_LG05G00971 [Camellia lanceoleosa]